jgi:hypothetical protein
VKNEKLKILLGCIYLLITGTDYNAYVQLTNSFIAEKTPVVWLVQIKDAGHAVISQYPYKINKILQTFPLTTTSHSWDIQSFTRGYLCHI